MSNIVLTPVIHLPENIASALFTRSRSPSITQVSARGNISNINNDKPNLYSSELTYKTDTPVNTINGELIPIIMNSVKELQYTSSVQSENHKLVSEKLTALINTHNGDIKKITDNLGAIVNQLNELNDGFNKITTILNSTTTEE
jgi:hypothetical protein